MTATAGTWWRTASPSARRALIAASLGWMLDAMDVLLYSFVLNDVAREFTLSDRESGVLLAAPLAASAVGGALFGWLADQAGRTRALVASILAYSIATAACGLSTSALQLVVCRILLGFGLGGEWATGAALVAETWPDAHRGKALGFMQSAWAVGYAAAAAVYALVAPAWGWRGVFFAGLAPALVTLWIRRHVEESPLWLANRHQRARHPARVAVSREVVRRGAIVTAMNAAAMFGWWGLFTWMPAYLSRPEPLGAGLSIIKTSGWIVLMQAGMWLGYVTFGYLADSLGRKPTYVGYLLVAAVLVPLYAGVRDVRWLLLLGPAVAFFGTGYFSGFGAITAEIFPTEIRATAQGVAYNLGRGLSALAPVTVGFVSERAGLGAAFSLTSAAFLVAAAFWIAIPETKGRSLFDSIR
jgi:MFS family permease